VFFACPLWYGFRIRQPRLMRHSGNLSNGEVALNMHLGGTALDMTRLPDNYPRLALRSFVPNACFLTAAKTSLHEHVLQSSGKTGCPFDGSSTNLVIYCRNKTTCRSNFVRHWFHRPKAQLRIELHATLLSLDRVSTISNQAKLSEEEVRAFATTLDAWSFTYKAERLSRALQVHFGRHYFELGVYAAAFVAQNRPAPLTGPNNHGATVVPRLAADPLLFHIVRILLATTGGHTVWEVKSQQDHTEERWVMRERLYQLPVWHGTTRIGTTCWEQHKAWSATERHRVKASDGKPLEPAMRIPDDLDIVPTDYTPAVPGAIALAIVHDVACPINASSS
jgi:hypothetical protein